MPFGVMTHSPRLILARGRQRAAFDRGAEMRRHMRRPWHREAHVGGAQRRNRHARRRQQRHPCRVRAKPRPACAAQGQNADLGAQGLAPLGRVEHKPLIQPDPGPAGAHHHPHPRQACQPGAQQRRGLHVGRKHPPGRAGKQRDPQILGPGADLLGAETGQHRRQPVAVIGGGKAGEGLVAGQVQTRFPGHQKFARRAGAGLGQKHLSARAGQRLAGHQPRRARANHQCVKVVRFGHSGNAPFTCSTRCG